MLYWILKGRQYDFLGEFSLKQTEFNNPQIEIDLFSGVNIYSNQNLASPSAFQDELRMVADMEDKTIEFLKNKFGEPTGERGNGCPIYKTEIPKEYLERKAS